MNDVLALLAEANPVHADGLASLEPPVLSRRLPSRRLVLAVAAALIAALIGVLATGHDSRSTHPSGGKGVAPPGPTGQNGPTGPMGPTSPQTIEELMAHPLASAFPSTLPDAAVALGHPLVLPDTPLVDPSDVGKVWAWRSGGGNVAADVAVTYPAQGVIVEYDLGDGYADPASGLADFAKGIPGSKMIELGTTPGVAIPGGPEGWSTVTFQIDGLVIRVIGSPDDAALEVVAQSIVDRSDAPAGTPGVIAPVARVVNLSDVSAAFGEPVVMPKTAFLQPSDAQGWQANRNEAEVWFPTAALSVTYLGPAPWPDSRAEFEEVARNVRFGDGEVVDLNGVPAVVIENQDAIGLGSIVFVWHDTRIEIDGFENAAILIDLAQSIVDQLQGTSSGPFTASPGVDFFPVVAPQEQIGVADTSATLGAPIVLPDTAAVQPSDAASAADEGQCPHATASSADGVSGCAVWVRFPHKSLTIVYERPGGSRAGVADGQVEAIPGAHLVDLGGEQALAIDRNAEGPSPGWIEFAIGGTRVILSGDYDAATLQSMAQSIVDRSK
jgi:hypothetical protein